MFQPLICGAFNHQNGDDNEPWSSPRKTSKSHHKDGKNPYSDRGLDKFSALLSELEDKRQKIYLQNGSQDIRFMYKNSTDCVPVVVKHKDEKQEQKPNPVETKDHHHQPEDKHPMKTLNEANDVKEISRWQLVSENTHQKKKKKKKKLFSWRRPSYYLPALLVLILVLLVFFGRSVSVLFTCIGWYIVPTIQGESCNKVRRRTKKDYVQKSEAVRSKHSSPVRDHQRNS
ncbi:ZCW7 isoform 1 [Hibiscus syriacus]|uniref:ZCW7 isoform 1 n=1 Tax=Hibiscus syriacus TaxID=106335 RepID=A0A6A2ZV71_HIBSY|nr:ZCW7 isoform 1 [Hibiscus syriacus]